MKLRQKLAMVLASAMIVTAVPVTTMAAQTTGLNKPAYSFIADTKVTTTAGLAISVKYDEAIPSVTPTEAEYVTVKAENFKFSKADYDYMSSLLQPGAAVDPLVDLSSVLEINWVSETEVEFKLASDGTETKFNLPLAGTPAKGTPVLSITGTSYTEPQKVTLGELTSTKALAVTADKVSNISLDGEGAIGTIVITEHTKGALTNDKIEIKLPNSSDLIFEKSIGATGTVKVQGKKGLKVNGLTTAVQIDAEYLTTGSKADEKVLVIDLGDVTLSGDRAGVLEITGIEVAPEDAKVDVRTGDVNVTVKATKGSTTTLDATSVKVATIAEEDVAIAISEKDVVMTAGQGTKTVEIVVTETLDGSLSRNLYLSVDGAQIVGFDNEADANAAGFKMGKDNKEISFAAPAGKTEHKVKVVLRAKAGTEGVVTLEATGKDLKEDLTKEIAKVEVPFTVESEGFAVETGVKEQQGGKIVIAEAKEGKFGRGQEFRIKSEDADLVITGAEVKTTGDVKVSHDVKGGEIIITVDRTSSEESEIIITDIDVNAKKYLAEGSYDFLIGGTAVSDVNKINTDVDNDGDVDADDKNDPAYNDNHYKQNVKAEDFVTTGEAEKSVEIGEGPEVYLNEDNRMMAKLRVVAEAFGVEPTFQHVDGVGVITFFKDGKVIQFTNGSNVMNMNGVAVPMDTKTVIKEDGYTYVPARFLAEALGLTVEWNEVTRVATFTTK